MPDLPSKPRSQRLHAAIFAVFAIAASGATGARSGYCTQGQGQGAAAPLVRAHAERDLDCPGSEIRIEEELTSYFKAIGCGRKARYRAACEGLKCVVAPEDGSIPWRDRPEPGTDVRQP
jgi:hypothetical protein